MMKTCEICDTPLQGDEDAYYVDGHEVCMPCHIESIDVMSMLGYRGF